MADDPKSSRRAIDFYTAEHYARIDERLKALGEDVDEISKKTNDSYYALFGGPSVADVGLLETTRRLVRNWALLGVVGGSIVGFVAGLFGYWIQKKYIDVATAPLYRSPSQELRTKMGKKRIKRWNPDEGKWDYYYLDDSPIQPHP